MTLKFLKNVKTKINFIKIRLIFLLFIYILTTKNEYNCTEKEAEGEKLSEREKKITLK